jgi:hypothetical protein
VTDEGGELKHDQNIDILEEKGVALEDLED